MKTSSSLSKLSKRRGPHYDYSWDKRISVTALGEWSFELVSGRVKMMLREILTQKMRMKHDTQDVHSIGLLQHL